VLSERLLTTQLDLVEDETRNALKQGFPVEKPTKPEEHALRLVGSVDSNRRALRRFLKAYWSGDTEFLSKHPATLAWYRKHHAIPRQLWEEGIPFRAGDLTIRMERDPFEILKLGTYVGSCLGVGGICSYSAAAALLDVNKQVLYARDWRGRVVARQLLAISDDNRLVCFSVYPNTCPQAVKAAFRDYDHAFAQALNIPLYRPEQSEDDHYRVSCIISTGWWDDREWDFDTTQ
jgi:hypothetical protein